VTYVTVMRDALTALGHDVTVVTSKAMMTPQGQVMPLPSSRQSLRLTALTNKLRSALGRPFDHSPAIAAAIAHAHHICPFDVFEMEESFGWSFRVAKTLDIPVVTRLHGPHFLTREPARDRADLRLQADRIARERRAIAHAAAVSGPSATQMRATLDFYHLAPTLVRHIPNPVSIPDHTQRWVAADASSKRIVMIGRFDTIKGADVAVQAFLVALQSDPDLELVIAGPDRGVYTKAGRMNFADFVASVATSDQASRIRFLGPLGAEAVAAMRLGAAMVIIPSRIENFPYTVAESLATGAPTIATDVYGSAEMITHGENGLLVPVADIEGLAAAMVRLAADRDEAARLGAAGRAFAIKTIAPGPIAMRSIALYKEACLNYRFK
jgi:glycosyltransferase involved in cell wall biosynthesis